MPNPMKYGEYEEIAEKIDDKVRSFFEFFNDLNDVEHELEGGYTIITDDPFSDDVQEVEICYTIKVKK